MADFQAIVIGAGAAGMMAAITAAERGRRVLLIEKNTKLGVKILMSGGTRCNLTHDESPREILRPFGRQQASFLKTAIGKFTPQQLIAFFRQAGVPTKSERYGKIFPESDRALDVQQALIRQLQATGVEIATNTTVRAVEFAKTTPAGEFCVATDSQLLSAEKVLITTGGASYPGCGTVGDGYAWVKHFGHQVITPVPALVPLHSSANWLKDLSGVSLEEVELKATASPERKLDKVNFSSDQPLLFTHFGLSGPGAMNVSKVFAASPGVSGQLRCDFLPACNDDQVRSLLQPTSGDPVLSLAKQLPRRLCETLINQAGVKTEKGTRLSNRQRQRLVDAIKRNAVPITGTRGFKKAEVTAGGVKLTEVDPKTMESLLQPGLFLAGEILDIDGPIGGYNFQAAFSTGRLAGMQL